MYLCCIYIIQFFYFIAWKNILKAPPPPMLEIEHRVLYMRVCILPQAISMTSENPLKFGDRWGPTGMEKRRGEGKDQPELRRGEEGDQ